jgi:NifU-like protein
MAKQDLIGGALWDNYSDKVAERMNDPRHLGEITSEEAESMNADLVVADHGAESCGDAVRLYLAVSREDGIIKKATFKSFGCGTAIASSDMMAELCVGKTVDEALQITNLDVESALRDDPDKPAVPPQKMHCSVMAYEVIKAAVARYRGVDIKSLEGEEIVCECARVSLRTIKDVIRMNDLTTVEQITDYTKAGGFCKSCIRPGGHESRKYYLEDILNEIRAEMDKKKPLNNEAFADMSPFKQVRALEAVIESEIRPQLHRDGGDLEIVDLRKTEKGPLVLIRYKGACATCVSSSVGTLSYIESTLKNKLDSNIRVEMG